MKKIISVIVAVIMLLNVPVQSIVYAADVDQKISGQEEQTTDKIENAKELQKDQETENEDEEENEQTPDNEEQETNSPAQSTMNETKTLQTRECTPELLNYVVVNKPYIQEGDIESILVSVGSGESNIESATLEYHREEDGKKYQVTASKSESDALLFEISYVNNAETGTYILDSLSYIVAGNGYTIEMNQAGINAKYGVNKEVATEADAEVVDDDSEKSEIQTEVVSFDKDGNQLSENSIEEAIEKQQIETISEETNNQAREKNKEVVVVLDPGHDDTHAGARGNGLKEEQLTLKIAQYCKTELEQYSGVKVYMTRTSESCPYPGTSSTDDNAQRVAYAKSVNASVYVSIHLNSGGASAKGTEVYYPNSNYRSDIGSEGKELASQVLNQLVSLGLTDRGIKIRNSEDNSLYEDGSLADYYGVIKGSKKAGFPGIIIEHAFLTNASDAAFLEKEDNLKKLGVADATGIAEYFNFVKESSSVEIEIKNKNDFAGVADIIIKGGGKSAKIAIWNEDKTLKKWYTLDAGSGTINFKKSDFDNATGKYCVEVYNSDKTQKICETSFRVSSDTSVKVESKTENEEITYQLKAEFVDMPDEVTGVEFPVWTTSNQSDIKWISAKQEKKGQWVAEVNVSDYKKIGEYNVHAYAVLQNGKKQFLGTLNFNVSDMSMSVSVENYQKDKGTFDVVIKNIKSASGVQKIQVPVWCAEDQKDLIWHTAKKQNDGSYKATISVAEHNYLTGVYNIQVHFTAMNGILKTYVAPNLTISKPIIELSGKDVNGNQMTYSLEVTNVGLVDYLTGVTFAVWSEVNGQDDLVWYSGNKVATDYYTAIADITNNHKTAGEYHLHAYGITSNGKKKFIGETTFEVTEPSMAVSVENYQKNKGTFDVVISNIKTPAGVSQIQVPVWCADDQKDLVWHIAKKQNDGSYKATIDIAEHDYLLGEYNIHVYMRTQNGILKTYVAPTLNVTMPNVDISIEDKTKTETVYDLKLTHIGNLKNVKRVQFAVWSEKNGQDDLVWYEGKKDASDQWISTVDIAKNHRTSGKYQVHVYVVTAEGKRQFLDKETFYVTEPSMSVSVENYQKDKGVFDVVIRDVKTPAGVSQIQVPVWCADGQKDLIWHTAEKQNDGSYKATINIADHGNLIGNYNIHVYMRTKNGVLKTYVTDGLNVLMPNADILITDTNKMETTYNLKITGTGTIKNVKRIQFAVWSEKNGQDDLVWYEGTKNQTNQWTAIADIAKNHRTSGKYQVHVYAVTTDGKKHFMGQETFHVTEPSMTVSIENYQKDKGIFDVVIRDVKTPAGVSQIQVPVWCADGQKDLIWHAAEKQNDGSYKATINIADHGNLIGDYKIHVYLRTKNGVLKTHVTDGLSVSMPNAEISIEDKEKTETNYELRVTNPGIIKDVKKVQFAVWSEKNGQDDLVWYEGHESQKNVWTATADIMNHKTSGEYQVHVYVVTLDGKSHFLGKATFEVKEPQMNVEVTNYQEEGRFEVIIKNIQCKSGIKQIRVPVWCADDQSDIYWYTAEKQGDGSYKAVVLTSNHKNAVGDYKIHVYLTAGNGVQKVMVAPSQSVIVAGYYTIMGQSTVTVDQLVKYYEKSGNTYPGTELAKGGAALLEQFCQIYYEEAQAEGVRVEVAFAQAMKETGWLKYGGIVKIEQFNFAGLGAEDGNATGECASFRDVREGVRAQIQHLKAYGSTEALNNTCVDPRFKLVRRGVAPYVEWLGEKENPEGVGWATAKNYGIDIVNMIKKLKTM